MLQVENLGQGGGGGMNYLLFTRAVREAAGGGSRNKASLETLESQPVGLAFWGLPKRGVWIVPEFLAAHG